MLAGWSGCASRCARAWAPAVLHRGESSAALLVPPADYDGEGGDKRRRRAGSRSAAASSGHAWAASAAAQQQQQPSGSGLAGAGIPEVVATEAADGRNVLRIKINRPGKQGEAGAAAGGSASARGGDPGCPLNFLAGLADGMGTPMGQQAAAGGGAAAAPKAEPKAEPVMLLSKKLLRVGWVPVGAQGLSDGARSWQFGLQQDAHCATRRGEAGIALVQVTACAGCSSR